MGLPNFIEDSHWYVSIPTCIWEGLSVAGRVKARALWAMKKLKMDWNEAPYQRLNGMNMLDEFRLKAYESSTSYKEKMKNYHDQRIEKREFAIGDLVLLFNSRLHLFLGKLKSK